MHISEFDYELPPELVAQEPLPRRDASRMLVVNRQIQSWVDSQFSALPTFLTADDVLVLNNTRVFPARLIGRRHPSGGRVEVMLVSETSPCEWQALVRPSHRLRKGALLRFGANQLAAEMLDEPGSELRKLKFDPPGPTDSVLVEIGQTPLPPYIKRSSEEEKSDRDRYQTIYATKKGAIAAPTAGLHFTDEMLTALNRKAIRTVEITLHVGYGTFAPVRVDEVENHSVAAENFDVHQTAAETLNECRKRGGRIVGVGTTTARALESAVNDNGFIEARSANTNLTIAPGYVFRSIDALLTNFHLPRSSLLLLVSAFAGRELILAAYRHAVEQRYRFYSYGDCMLII
ncbi:MAG: tRNA preQ1(34) S-adenosylmethionine ribosyltransferase-isomerase QueA [Acidobacteria bacterium]|nr:MAG: tRNA preQ1(34) S-adenosylmethionine ribosyltransferase-isomerase QueA [Acidobacteriota bacterium]